MGGSDGGCTGALLRAGGWVVVRENSEDVSLSQRLKGWEGASRPRSEQREERVPGEETMYVNARWQGPRGVGGTEWRQAVRNSAGGREDEPGGQTEVRRQSRPCRALQATVWTSVILSAAEVIAGYQAGRQEHLISVFRRSFQVLRGEVMQVEGWKGGRWGPV